MARPLDGLVRTARGATTVGKRRGIGYLGYLVGGVLWPRAAYRFGWGPSAPPILQGAFAPAAVRAAQKQEANELIDLALTVEPGTAPPGDTAQLDEVEHLMDRAHSAGITG